MVETKLREKHRPRAPDSEGKDAQRCSLNKAPAPACSTLSRIRSVNVTPSLACFTSCCYK